MANVYLIRWHRSRRINLNLFKGLPQRGYDWREKSKLLLKTLHTAVVFQFNYLALSTWLIKQTGREGVLAWAAVTKYHRLGGLNNRN